MNPRLVWGLPPNFSPTGYKIYRSVSGQTDPPGTFYLIATINNGNATEYTDVDWAWGSGNIAYYKIKAFNSSTETDFSNMVSGRVAYYKQTAEQLAENIDYSLMQNFPNPFNPVTKISYSIKEDGLVTLKVYDLLGNEVETLVDEPKNKGNYETSFNASKLASGIYIYQLRVNNFSDTKKLVLMK